MRVTFVGLGWEQLGIGLLAALAKARGDEVSLAFSAALFRDRYNLFIFAFLFSVCASAVILLDGFILFARMKGHFLLADVIETQCFS